jgi:hypothetical protein
VAVAPQRSLAGSASCSCTMQPGRSPVRTVRRRGRGRVADRSGVIPAPLRSSTHNQTVLVSWSPLSTGRNSWRCRPRRGSRGYWKLAAAAYAEARP